MQPVSTLSSSELGACMLELHGPVGLSGATWQAVVTSGALACDLQGTALV